MLDLSKIQNLAITGANGFVGRSVINKVSSLKSEQLPGQITLITRTGIDFRIPENIANLTNLVEQDLTKPWVIESEVTHFINLAADGSKSPYSKEANSNFEEIGKNFVEWIKSTINKPKVFHASSGACFGVKPLNNELDQNESKSGFIKARIFVEKLLIEASRKEKFDLSIGRLFTFSGIQILDKKQYAITQFIESAVKESRIYVHGDPQTVRSFLHEEAMAEMILKSLFLPSNSADLQIGSSEPVTIGELAEFIAAQTGAEVVYTKEFQFGDIYLPDNSSTMSKLGLSEGKNWKSAVQEMISAVRLERDVAN